MATSAPSLRLYRPVIEDGVRDAWVARIAIDRGGEVSKLVDVVLGRRRRAQVAERDGVNDHDRIRTALLQYAVRRLGDMLRQNLEPPDEILVQDTDVPLLQSLLAEKTCEYKYSEGRELYCSVAGEENAVAIGLRRLFPTSRALCNACTLPATDYACSHLHHPKVAGLTDYREKRPDGQGGFVGVDPFISRQVYSALCDLGRPEIAQAERCRPGGNPCWERVVEAEIAQPPAAPAALALPEALDYFAVAWELTLGRPLFRARSTVIDAALAVMDCGTLSDLVSLLSKLTDVLNAIVIEDDLLPETRARIEKGHSLARLLAALKEQVPGEMHADMDRAVGMLQTINAIRTGYQHQERRAELPDAFGRLRLNWPPESPQQTWDGIRARTIEAASIIRDALRQLPPHHVRPPTNAPETN